MCLVTTPEKMKQELESQLGCEINSWGTCSHVSEQKVKDILFEQINGISQKIHEQMVSDFCWLLKSY
jgi:hypothetical protein